MQRQIFTEEHELFRTSFRRFAQREIVPFNEQWESDGIVDRSLFEKAGAAGFLGMQVPEEYGGGGNPDYRFSQIIGEELELLGVGAAGSGISLHNDIVLPYFIEYGTEAQKQRWLPGLCSGALIAAVGMSEPGTGSDLAAITTTAVRDGDHYVVNGAKTFISNGILADVVVTAVKTDPGARHRGISLLVLERGIDGFERGRNLDKIGRHSQDTAELSFVDARVPVANRLGDEGTGFHSMMHNLPQERLNIAVNAVAGAQYAFDLTLGYVKERTAFGQPIGSFQNSKFKMAEIATELEVAWAFLDRAVMARVAGELTAEEAAMAKWWTTEFEMTAIDTCLQLHGGYGYMAEYPISRLWRDARVQRIYGGTTEIMKEIVGRSLGL